jgi:hypothetical protein
MPLDPSIILGYRPPQIAPPDIPTPLEQFGKVLTLRGLMQQGQLRGLEIEQAQRAAAATEAINRVLRGEAPPGVATIPGTVPAAPAPVAPGLAPQPQIGGVPEGAFWLPKPAPAVAPTAAPAPGGGTLPGGSVSLSQLSSLTPRLLQAGGAAALPIVENISKAAKAQIDQHISALDLEKKESAAIARLVGGITDDDSLKRALVAAANKDKIPWDDVRRYSDLGFANPATQSYLKQKGLESLDYDKSVELALKNAKEERDKLEFADKQRDQKKTEFAQGVQNLTDVSQFPAFLARQDPYIQAFYGGLAGFKDLDKLKQAVTLSSVKPEVGKTVAEPEAVQAGKVAVSAATGLAAKEAELGLQQRKNAAAVEASLKDPTGKYYANLPETVQKEIAPTLAERGFTAFGAKPTDVERRVLNFYERSKEAEDSLTKPRPGTGKSLEQMVSEKGIVDQLRFQYAPNVAQKPEDQLYWQALRQFTEARLRKESGAAIAAHEYTESQKTYFPVPGDSKEVLEQKRQARQGLLESMKQEAGPAYTQKQPETKPETKPIPAPTAAAMPTVGATVPGKGGKKYRFIGGDPNDPKNWPEVHAAQ